MERTEYVILVDENDRELGTMEKQEAHEKGVLHRALSVFIFNSAGELLIQQRALGKYHSAGLWTNTCCSHPRPGETTAGAAHRRLREEMGFDCALEEKFHFMYRTSFDNGLTEHELDFVFTGLFNGDPVPDPLECRSWKWMQPVALLKEMIQSPSGYTSWLRIILQEHAGLLW